MPKESIVTTKKCCFFCGSEVGLERHHCWGGPNRRLSEEDGLVVYLCWCHHRGPEGVHGIRGNESRRHLMEAAEEAWIRNYGTEDDFRRRYGKSVL